MTPKRQEIYLKKNWLLKSNSELCNTLKLSETGLKKRAKKLNLPNKKPLKKVLSPSEVINHHKETLTNRSQHKNDTKAIKQLLEQNEQLQKELEASVEIKKGLKPFVMEYRVSDKLGEAVAVAVASDFHIEETVRPETVNGLNKYTLDIAKARAEQFFVNTLKLVEKEQTATRIDTLVLMLLGDFISGNIHEELLETCSLRPIEAIILAENLLVSGIDYLLANSKLKLIIPCHVGNHTRITKKVHIGTETGNSLETFMYCHMREHYKNNKRVTFAIAEGYLSYLKVWDFTICMHHGHSLKFNGGIGGLTIPVRKAISQWEKLRHADLYVMGHWHTLFDGGNFIVNGSLIGYNPFAMFIKADFERPRQSFFLISKKYNAKTVSIPIMFDQ